MTDRDDPWKRYAGQPMPHPFTGGICEVCGKPARSPLDFAYWPSTMERPLGNGTYHVVHPHCTETLVASLEKIPAVCKTCGRVDNEFCSSEFHLGRHP